MTNTYSANNLLDDESPPMHANIKLHEISSLPLRRRRRRPIGNNWTIVRQHPLALSVKFHEPFVKTF